MGMFDKLREFFKGSKNTPEVQREDPNEKFRLAFEIVNLIYQIKRINSLDTSILNIGDMDVHDFERRYTLDELKRLRSDLSGKIAQIQRSQEKSDARREEIEATKWTGRKTKGMSDGEFDRLQRDER